MLFSSGWQDVYENDQCQLIERHRLEESGSQKWPREKEQHPVTRTVDPLHEYGINSLGLRDKAVGKEAA